MITEQNVPILVRKHAFLSLKNYRFLFPVHTFPCATSPRVFLNCHAFKLCAVNADYAIFTVTHSELFISTRRIQRLGVKPKLSSGPWCPLLGHRISGAAWAHPEQVFSFSGNFIMGTSIQREQKANPGS